MWMARKRHKRRGDVIDLARRCTFTVEYQSKAFVEDAMLYARWILRLKDASPEKRAQMLRELDGEPPLPDLDPGDKVPETP